jgi:hypothetical protein
MRPGQVVSLLGHQGDPAQFRRFQFPRGCWLQLSTDIGELVVSLQVKNPPEPQQPCDKRLRRRRAVCAAYICALSGPRRQPEGEPPTRRDIDALCTWLEAVESWTRASASTLAWTGAVRIEAQPTFTISVWRTPGATGASGAPRLTVEVASGGTAATTTTVPPAAHSAHPTVRAVEEACATGLSGLSGLSGLTADAAKYAFSPDWDELTAWRGGDDGGLFLVGDEPSVISVTPRKMCLRCHKYPLDACNYILPRGWWHLASSTIMCIECATDSVVRLWGTEFTLSVTHSTPHSPTPTVEFSAPVKVEVTEPFDSEAYYAQCRAVPLESTSIWQRLAHDACAAEDLLLRIAGRPVAGPLLGLLSKAIILTILAHLKRAVLPPNREACP